MLSPLVGKICNVVVQCTLFWVVVGHFGSSVVLGGSVVTMLRHPPA